MFTKNLVYTVTTNYNMFLQTSNYIKQYKCSPLPNSLILEPLLNTSDDTKRVV